ncbi:MAG: hypothetical protein IKB50_02885 [Clostridia bacterium]|nr:hypothetical protein [Clostridia bacterium]
MNKKKLIICVLAIVVIIAAIIIVLISCGNDDAANYRPKGNLEKAYKLIEQGEFEKAEDEICKYQEKISERDEDESYITKEEFDGFYAYMILKIEAGKTDDEFYDNYHNNVAHDIYELTKSVFNDEIELDPAVIPELKKLVEWYLVEYIEEDDISWDLGMFTERIPELAQYFSVVKKYDATEPHSEYEELYIDGKPTGRKDYIGTTAYVRWQVEGFEDVAPYKELERKYINNEPTDEIRYTGKTKSGSSGKKYPYPKCPDCGYSAASDPSGHPGHGLEGVTRFERGQNSDGSWGFIYE